MGLNGPDHEALHAQVCGVRGIFEGLPLIPAIKRAVSLQYDDPDYGRVRPPFTDLAPTHAEAIAEALRIAGPQSTP